MTRSSPGTDRGVLDAYAGADRRARWHTRLRWASAPLPAVADLVPSAASVLDLGCGHGLLSLLLARRAPDRVVHGVDVDPAKVAVARAAASRAGLADRVTFSAVAPDLGPGSARFDAILVVDVLYLLGRAQALTTLDSLPPGLAPGGALVVKEMALAPRWKAGVNRVQETLAVRVLGLTAGSEVAVLDPTEIEAHLARAGLALRRVPLDAGYPHPHLAVVGTAP